VRCWAAFVAVLLVVGYFTGVLTPLLDRVWAMVNTSSPLTTPAPVWQQQLGGTPRSGTIAGGAVIIEHRTLVESREIGRASCRERV